MHKLFIYLHTIFATISILVGGWLLFAQKLTQAIFYIYFSALIGMTLFLIAALAIGWNSFNEAQTIIFPILVLLLFYMIFRAWNALKVLHNRSKQWRQKFIDDLGFTVIALFDGFVIVLAMNLGAPVWLIVLIAIGGVWAGRRAIMYAKSIVR